MVELGLEPVFGNTLPVQCVLYAASEQALSCAWSLFPAAFLELVFFSWLDSGKPAVDPAAAKLWTLSANDMEDESVVSPHCGPTRVLSSGPHSGCEWPLWTWRCGVAVPVTGLFNSKGNAPLMGF